MSDEQARPEQPEAQTSPEHLVAALRSPQPADDTLAAPADDTIAAPADDTLADTSVEDADEAPGAAEEEAFEAPSLRSIIGQTLFISGLILVAIVLGSAFLKAPLQAFSHWIVETFGVFGILIGIMMSDTLMFPIPPDTYLFVAVATNKPILPMLTAICVVSVLSGSLAYLLGPKIQKIPFLSRKIEAWRPRGEALFARWGVWAIAIAALSPLPYSSACWFAGIYKMPYRRFALATLFRIPRMVGYYLIIMLGWGPG